MSFGFGVGDIIKAIELCHKLRRDFADAPRQWQEINEEIRSLSIVLGDVDVCISNKQLLDKDRQDLLETARECWKILDEMEDIANTNRVVDSSCGGTADRVKRVWKRLKWDPEVVRDIRGRISSNVVLLNAFHHRIARNNTAKLMQHAEDQETRTALDWLCPVDYGAQQNDLFARRQPNTGEWLLNSPEFQQWLRTPGTTMFCPGIPGAGKTIMTAVVVEHLMSRPEVAEGIGIAYIYFNFRRAEEQTLTHVVASLVKQLAQQQICAAEKLKSLHCSHNSGSTRPSVDELLGVLHAITVSPSFSRLFILIDALDECQFNRNLKTKFLSELSRIQQEVKVNLFATSRFIPEIQDAFRQRGAAVVEIRASNEDIHAYLDSTMGTLPGCVRRSPQLQDEIKSTILGTVDGMFLLAQIYASSLEDKLTAKAIRMTLGNFREQGVQSKAGEDAKLEALSQAYDQVMERIQSQRQRCRELALNALLWIVHASRPLTTLELTHALAIDGTQLVVEEDNMPELEDIIAVCNGLVTVDEESNIIRLVHYTTQQYFENKRECWFPGAEWTITSACLATLMVADWGLASLQNYAAEHWGHHLARAPAATQRRRQVIEFLRLDDLSTAWNRHMCWDLLDFLLFDENTRKSIRMEGMQLSGLHLAAHFGLEEAMDELITGQAHSIALDVMDRDRRTPLFYAIKAGNEDAARMLIRRGANPGIKAEEGETPLAVAAERGHEKIVQMLIENDAKVDHTWIDGSYLGGWSSYTTALCVAVCGRHTEMVRVLLAHGADIEFEKGGEMPIFMAASAGNVEIIQLLIENGADIESADRFMTTPLMQACLCRHHEAVKCLLYHGANIERINNDGETALCIAANAGSEPILLALMAAGARIDVGDFLDQTPLLLAARRGHAKLVELLLSRGGNVEAYRRFIHRKAFFREPRESDLTPLLAASGNGHASTVRLLLDYNADMEVRDAQGNTPLLLAARQAKYDVVKLLAERGADIHAQARDGKSTLWLVWSRGNDKELAKLLFEKGARLRRRRERKNLKDWLDGIVYRGEECRRAIRDNYVDRSVYRGEEFQQAISLSSYLVVVPEPVPVEGQPGLSRSSWFLPDGMDWSD